jgi:hypothetical protein
MVRIYGVAAAKTGCTRSGGQTAGEREAIRQQAQTFLALQPESYIVANRPSRGLNHEGDGSWCPTQGFLSDPPAREFLDPAEAHVAQAVLCS